MPTREDMHSLGQGIIGAFEARTAGIASLRDEVRGYRQRTQVHLREIEADVREQRQATQTQLGELDRNHRAVARHLQADLSRVRPELKASVKAQLRDMGQGRAALTTQEGRRKTEVHTWLKEADRAHNAVAQQLQADLNRAETARRQDEAQRARDRGQVVAQRRSDVNVQFRELNQAHNAMAQRQREDLEMESAKLIQVERLRKSEVKTWLEDVAAVGAGARAAWRDLVAAMGTKRTGAVAVAEAPPKVAPPPPVARAVAPAITTEEDAVQRAVVGEVTTEFASLTDRVFVYLANHPDGTRLTELEREIGLSRFQAARAVRHLIDEGKTEKRDFCYFAI